MLLSPWSLLAWTIAWVGAYIFTRRRFPSYSRDILAIGAIILATVGFYWPIFLARGIWMPAGGGDLASFLYPTYTFAARWIRRGVIPLWNPHLYMGMPFAADNQSGVFYPINLLFFLLTPEITYRTMEQLAVFHTLLAGVGAYLAFRELDSPSLPRPAALFGAIAFQLSDLFVTHFGNLNIIATAAWLPWVIWAFRRALHRRVWKWAGIAGILLGTAFLAGHAQLSLYLVLALGIVTIVHTVTSPSPHRWSTWRQPILQLGLTVIIAAGLAAPMLLPAAEMVPYTVRAELNYAEASAYSLPPAGLIGLLIPGFYGRGPGRFWGPWQRVETGYLGVLPLLLAPLALRRTRRTTLPWAILALFGLLLALGDSSFLHGWLYAIVPGFRNLRVPARSIVLLDFGIAALAALGFATLLDSPLPGKTRALLLRWTRTLRLYGGITLAVAIPSFAYHVLQRIPAGDDALKRTSAALGGTILFALLFAAGIAWLGWRKRHHSTPVWIALGLLLLFTDLATLGSTLEIEVNDPTAGFDHPKVVAFLRQDPGPFRIETMPETGWQPDWALLHGIDDWGGIWNPLRLGAYNVLTWVGIDRSERFYDTYNVKYLIAPKHTPVPAKFVPVFDDNPTVTVYLNTQALPRAWLVHNAEIVPGPIAALQRVRSSDFDPTTTVVLDEDQPAEVAPLQAIPTEGARSLAFVEYIPNRITLDVTTPVEGYVVLSEMWYPGWNAKVDGVPQPVLRANYTFRAVYVPPGEHRVTMSFTPPGWTTGLIAGLVTLSALLGWGITALSRRIIQSNPTIPSN